MTPPTDHPPRPGTAPPVLVGREREEAVLRAHLDEALGGRGGVVLIGGEAGIGKTALAEALCREAAAQGALVLVGRCYDRTETPPYGPWLELFAHCPVDSTPPFVPAAFVKRGMIAPVESQAALFQEVQRFLDGVASSRPLILLFDDLHWADPASLDLLRSVARMTTRLPPLLLVTYRANELTRRHPLNHLMPLLEREACAVRLNLQPLTADAVRALIGARYRLTERDIARLTTYLHQRAEGNAFFTTELLRALEEGGLLHHAAHGWTLGELVHTHVPVPLRQVIDGRLARLGEEAQPLLAVAAVIGQDVPLNIWATVTGVDEETLSAIIEQAATAHLMDETPDGTRARFVHALIRETLYEGILPSRRRRMHRQVGEALMEQASADPDAVAHHFRQAGDGRAAEWLVIAGDRAERAYALVSAAERYIAAVALMESAEQSAAQRGWLLLRAGWMRRVGGARAGLAPIERAVQLAKQADDRLLAACAQYFHGQLLCFVQEFRQGLAESHAAVDAFSRLPPEERSRLRALDTVGDHLDDDGRFGSLALWRAFIGEYDVAQTMATQVVAERATASDPRRRENTSDHYAWRALSIIHASRGQPEKAREAYTYALGISDALNDYFQFAVTAADKMERLILPYFADDLTERGDLGMRIAEANRRSGAALTPAYVGTLQNLAALAVDGGWETVRRAGLAQRAAQGGTGEWSSARRALGVVARDQGDTELAWLLVREMLPDGPATAPGDRRFLDATAMQRLAAIMAMDDGDLSAARDWLEAYDRWLDWNGTVIGRADGDLGWARYHRAAGDTAAAYRHAHQALAHASEPRQPLALLAAHRLIGELDTAAGRFDDAVAHLAEALALADACAAPYERALTLLAQATLCVATSNRVEALTLLDAVYAICTPLCTKPVLARVDALATSLARLPVTPPIYTDGMTEREVAVLRHIATGLSNREIAERLSLSIRTIERHIENLYRKIGVRSKAEATAYAFHHDLA